MTTTQPSTTAGQPTGQQATAEPAGPTGDEPTRGGPTEDQVMEFLLQVAGDAGAAMSGVSVALGDRLGLYAAMADGVAVTSVELATRTGLNERYIREWLAVQAALRYVDYDPATRAFTLPPAHAAVLSDPTAPTYLAGVFLMLDGVYATEDALEQGFRDGSGVGWDEHPDTLFKGTAKFFRPGYEANLVAEWLPAMDGVVAKLESGARVADIGCGYGFSTMIMARNYPASTVVGYDYHPGSVERARELAAEAGLSDRVSFEVASAQVFPGTGYDLITSFDCLHDMGDPGAVAEQVRGALADDGTWMIVEPNASEQLEVNLQNPFAKVFMGASAVLCLPSAIAQHGPQALGNHAGEGPMREIVTGAGFDRWRRALETPINAIFEARP